jgi:hypothetical protein
MLCHLKTPLLSSNTQQVLSKEYTTPTFTKYLDAMGKYFFSSKYCHDDENTILIVGHNTKWNPSEGLLENIWQLHDITFYCYATTKSLKDNDINQALYHWQAQIQKRKVLPNLLSWMSMIQQATKSEKEQMNYNLRNIYALLAPMKRWTWSCMNG